MALGKSISDDTRDSLKEFANLVANGFGHSKKTHNEYALSESSAVGLTTDELRKQRHLYDIVNDFLVPQDKRKVNEKGGSESWRIMRPQVSSITHINR